MQNLKKEKGKKVLRFLRRKIRINTGIKSRAPDFRVIIEKSNMYIKAQVLDQTGRVVAHISDKGVKAPTKTARSELAGQALAALMKKQSIEQAAFDRNGNLYHGRVKAFAE